MLPSNEESLRSTLTSFSVRYENPTSSPSQKRGSATPAVKARTTTDSPDKLLPRSLRGQSNDSKKPAFKFDSLKSDYETLKVSYQKILEENLYLLSEKKTTNFNESSTSTVTLEKASEFPKQSFAEETDDLSSMLSQTHESIQILLTQCRKCTEEYQSLRRQLNLLKFQRDLHDSTKDVKIGLVIII